MEKTFGERLKKIREDKKETQSDLAKALNIRRENIIRYENGDLPKFEVVIKIARHYNTTIDYFAGLIDSPFSYDKYANKTNANKNNFSLFVLSKCYFLSIARKSLVVRLGLLIKMNPIFFFIVIRYRWSNCHCR